MRQPTTRTSRETQDVASNLTPGQRAPSASFNFYTEYSSC
jgi:hypothetical protein